MKKALIGLVAILTLVAVSPCISSSTENIAYAQDTNSKEPFTTKIENNKYIINYSGDMVYVGKGTDTFVPEITMYRFGQECSLTLYEPTINGDTLSQKNAGSTLTGDTIQWASKDIQFLFYPKNIDDQNDKGSFEYEIVIANSKAGTDEILSSISFPITSSGLNFYYQPELTQEEMDEGAYRPDNVIGSYAVYHSTKRDHIEGQINYGAGKAFHIYRPMLIDSAGDMAWANLIITGTNLIIDFSEIQDWLNKAKYPVRIDPTFGYTAEGGTQHTIYADAVYGCQYLGATGTGVSITWNLCQDGSYTPIMKFALYDADDNFVENSSTGEWTLTGGWDDEKTLDFVVAPSLTAQNYHIALWTDNGYVYTYWDAGETDQMKTEAWSYNGWPASVTWSGGNWDRKETVYCTYTPAEGEAPDPPTNFAATENQADKVTCTWTKSDGATKYQVYRDGAPIGGELGDVDTWDDITADAPTITAGNAVASDGIDTAHIVLSLAGTSANNGTVYSYKVRAGNADGWSSDSNIDDGKRIPGVLTYQWQRSVGDDDAGYGILVGATTDPYNDATAPAGVVTPGVATASDGTSTAHITLSIAGESVADGAGRWYYCEVSATGAATQDATHNRGYRTTGALTYQWWRSNADANGGYVLLAGVTTESHDDATAPTPTITPGNAVATDGTHPDKVALSLAGTSSNDGAGRWYYCILDATGCTQQTTGHNRGYRDSGALSYQWEADRGAGWGDIAGAVNATYDDDATPAGTVTPGVASASDGTSIAHSTLGLASEGINDGATNDYRCKLTALDATEQTSGFNTGFRRPTDLTYQWYRSADDLDADYGILVSATTDPYNDTTIPEDEGRWYYCEISATGAVVQDSTHDRGYSGDLPVVIPDVSVGEVMVRQIPVVIACVIFIFIIRRRMDARNLLFGAVVGLLAFIIVNAIIKSVFA